jgi:hypothetical protein
MGKADPGKILTNGQAIFNLRNLERFRVFVKPGLDAARYKLAVSIRELLGGQDKAFAHPTWIRTWRREGAGRH